MNSTLTPWEMALQLYAEIGEGAQDLMRDMAWHVHHGYVYASPSMFAMVRPVCTSWGAEAICDCTDARAADGAEFNELTSYPDCWHIHLAVGEMRELLSRLPYALPYLSYERRGVFKLHSMESFKV
ncbi:hypothetical protein Rhal01_03752 [Rubritalea halochordaticola]|uniref:Uncharacterized protein n=1 Tax=Rubritalea halochordaticola TaxID=714537 RepID=A0ABP9V921_9BACT